MDQRCCSFLIEVFFDLGWLELLYRHFFLAYVEGMSTFHKSLIAIKLTAHNDTRTRFFSQLLNSIKTCLRILITYLVQLIHDQNEFAFIHPGINKLAVKSSIAKFVF